METNNQQGFENEAETPSTKADEMKKGSSGNKLTLKGLIVFTLILIMLIPMIFISNLVTERKHRQSEVKEEVSQKWARSQSLTGPILIIPYQGTPIKEKTGTVIGYETEFLYLLPEELNINGTVAPHTRYRSIFEVTVYQSKLSFSGHFVPLDLSELQIIPEHLLLDKAKIFFGLSDFRGIEEQLTVQWDSTSLELMADGISDLTRKSGLYASVKLSLEDVGKRHDFSIDFNIKGSEDLLFSPIGKTNKTCISSPWKNPSFIGNFIPNTPAEISTEGFDAEWKILYLNRSYPQVWKNKTYNISESTYGVKLLQSTDSYAKTERSVKYAILFVSLTFALYFFIEILQKKKVHPIQYVLVGIALCVFYTLLLSFSEYIPFNYAYLIASLATISLISLYTKSAFRKWKIATVFGLVLFTLYGFIFILIQLQDRALLFGSIGLFAVLAIAMYYSRKIDWYGHGH